MYLTHELTPKQFELMEDSLDKDTADTPGDVGISITLWKLRALMAGYRWALSHGMDHGT